MSQIIAFLGVIFLAFSFGTAQATTYWASPGAVSTTLSTCDGDSDPGSYCTLNSILSGMSGSDTATLKEGIYAQEINVNSSNDIPSGTSGNPTRVRCETIANPTANGGTSPACVIRPPAGSDYVILHQGEVRSHIIYDSLKLDGTVANATLIRAWRTSSGECDSCFLINSEVTAEGTTIGGTSGRTPIVAVVPNGGFINNWIHHWEIASGTNTHGIYTSVSNVTITDNLIHDTSGLGIQYYNAQNAPFSGGLIARNKIFDTGTRCILVGVSNTGAVVRNNSLVNCGTHGIELRGPQQKAYHNSVYSAAQNGIYTNGNAGTQEYKNNISLANGTNCSFSTADATNNTCTGSATDYWTNPASGDLTLKSTSPAINTGGTISGFPCNGICDRGAYESIPTTGITAVSTDNSIDITLPMNLNVPLLPASGITGFTLSDGRTVTSASRNSDSAIRLFYSGTCTGGTFSYSPGNVTDSALVGGTNQALFALSNVSITNDCGGGAPPPPAGLHIHYEFDENTGTSANDETANNLDGTLSAATLWTSGRTGSAVAFVDEVADNVAVPYGSGVNPSTQSLTIAFDFLYPTLGSFEVMFGSPRGTDQRLFIGKTNNDTLGIGIQSSQQQNNTEFSISAGTWYRACLNMNSSTDTGTLHLNGVAGTTAESVKSYTSYTLAGNFQIGREADATGGLPGVLIDNFKLWTSVESCADDYASEFPPGGGTAMFTQVAYQWNLGRKDPAGNLIKLPSSSSAVNTPIKGSSGGFYALDIQVDCDNVADCDAVGLKLQFDVDGSDSWADVSDNCAIKGCFYGTGDTDSSIPSGVPGCPLSGALTCVNGGTQRTSSAVPSVDLGQNQSTVLRYIIKPQPNVGEVLRFRVVQQDNTVLGTYTNYATFTGIDAVAGAGF